MFVLQHLSEAKNFLSISCIKKVIPALQFGINNLNVAKGSIPNFYFDIGFLR